MYDDNRIIDTTNGEVIYNDNRELRRTDKNRMNTLNRPDNTDLRRHIEESQSEEELRGNTLDVLNVVENSYKNKMRDLR